MSYCVPRRADWTWICWVIKSLIDNVWHTRLMYEAGLNMRGDFSLDWITHRTVPLWPQHTLTGADKCLVYGRVYRTGESKWVSQHSMLDCSTITMCQIARQGDNSEKIRSCDYLDWYCTCYITWDVRGIDIFHIIIVLGGLYQNYVFLHL